MYFDLFTFLCLYDYCVTCVVQITRGSLMRAEWTAQDDAFLLISGEQNVLVSKVQKPDNVVIYL